MPPRSVHHAEVVLPAPALADAVRFFTEDLGFRVDAIIPADDPAIAVLSGHGLRLRLDRHRGGDPGVLRLGCAADDPAAGTTLTAPNGTRVEVAVAEPPVALPPLVPAWVHARAADARWIEGRAGMQYRDLIPGRQGGRFVASHIRIPDGGPVPDYVHFHRVHFQLIYCHRGWVRVVYEDQGPPFVLQPGDAVLQPPRIRHRVLEASPGLEVIEIGCPAEHETWADHDLVLPTARVDAARDFDGQRFVRDVAAEAPWRPWRHGGFVARVTEVADATAGLAAVEVARARAAGATTGMHRHDAELRLWVVLAGGAIVRRFDGGGDDDVALADGDALVVPAGVDHALDAVAGLELLEVRLPAGQGASDPASTTP
ncbi:MAG: cupin domain-containing protein [Kofleriaceae bacterium]|nr:cupin domain-containing protein [Myxococcales bacterium]MCB9562574.1 cupin domain-containing protein [Kofleriaceae bacterium]